MIEIDNKLIEDNKLIAVFEGYPESDYDLMILSAVSFKMNEGYQKEYAELNYDLYHNCWKYLMPICQKIKNTCIIESIDNDVLQVIEFQQALLNLDLSEIHTKVVSFIRFYNKKKAEESLNSTSV